MNYTATLVLAFASCLALQHVLLQAATGHSLKGESNYFTSLARLQAACRQPAQTLLLGSSITGRLPDRSQGFTGVANLGCDGGSAVDTLRAIDRGQLPPAPRLFIEVNTLVLGLSPRPSAMLEAMRAPMFKAGVRLPPVAAASRPATLLYSQLHAAHIGRPHGVDGQPLPVIAQPEIPTAMPQLNPAEQQLAEELAAILRRLRERGTQAVMVVYPKGQSASSPNVRIARAAACLTPVPFWDLAHGLPDSSVRMTDDTHMAPDSAAACLRALLQGHPFTN